MIEYVGSPLEGGWVKKTAEDCETSLFLEKVEKKPKKLEKTFQKGIDKQITKWYNRKVDARATAN